MSPLSPLSSSCVGRSLKVVPVPISIVVEVSGARVPNVDVLSGVRVPEGVVISGARAPYVVVIPGAHTPDVVVIPGVRDRAARGFSWLVRLFMGHPGPPE